MDTHYRESRDKDLAKALELVQQIEEAESGAACLTMVLRAFGVDVSLEEVRHECLTVLDGFDFHNIQSAARTYGFEATISEETVDQVLASPTGTIILWNEDSSVVVKSSSRKFVEILDPAEGLKRIRRQRFEQSYSGIALRCEPPPGFIKKELPPSSSFKDFSLGILSNAWLSFFFYTLVGISIVVPTTLLALLTSLFVDQILTNGVTSWLAQILVFQAIAVVLLITLQVLSHRLVLRLDTALSIHTTSNFMWHLLRLPSRFFDGRTPGSLAKRVSLNGQLVEFTIQMVAVAAVNVTRVILYFIILFFIDPLLAIVALALALGQGLLLKATARVRNATALAEKASYLTTVGYSYVGIQLFDDLRATGTERDYLRRLSGNYAQLSAVKEKSKQISAAVNALPVFIRGAVLLATLSIGGWQVLQGNMTVGALVAFQMLVPSMVTPVVGILTGLSEISANKAQLAGINSVLTQPTRADIDQELLVGSISDIENQLARQRAQSSSPENRKLEGKLTVNNLCFDYSLTAPFSLKDISFTVEPGQRIGIVGKTGSGKTTLANLLSGALTPSSGTIEFDGRERDQIPRQVATSSIAKVDQSSMLFKGSIVDNVSFWDPSIPIDDVIEACRDAEIHEEFEQKPGGYEYQLTERGSNLSGGQRQRTEIARVLAKDPSLIILDEATSALDATREARIGANIKRRGCTSIVIAHRLLAIHDCDLILVLEDGQIVEQGTHSELLDRQGVYVELMQGSEGE